MLASFGVLVMLVGLAVLGAGLWERRRSVRALSAPLVRTGDVGNAVAMATPIAVEGNVVCDQPLIAPITGRVCLYYRLRYVVEGPTTNTRPRIQMDSRIVDEQRSAAIFGIDDGSGIAWIDARNGGDFDPLLVVTRTRTGPAGEHAPRIPGGPDTRYRVEEEILPFVPRLHARGKAGPGTLEPGLNYPMLLSSKSRSQLVEGAMLRTHRSLALAFAFVVLGSAIGALGLAHREPAIMTASYTTTGATLETSTVPAAPASTPALSATPPVEEPPVTALPIMFVPPPPPTTVTPSPPPPSKTPAHHARKKKGHR